jgi:hypothetical protein
MRNAILSANSWPRGGILSGGGVMAIMAALMAENRKGGSLLYQLANAQ